MVKRRTGKGITRFCHNKWSCHRTKVGYLCGDDESVREIPGPRIFEPGTENESDRRFVSGRWHSTKNCTIVTAKTIYGTLYGLRPHATFIGKCANKDHQK